MLEENKLSLPQCFRCTSCDWSGSTFKASCPSCGSGKIVQFEGSKGGKIVDFVAVLFPPENLKSIGKYVSAFVQLDNGCRIFGILLEDPQNLSIGGRVEIARYESDSKKLFFKSV